MDRHEKVRLSLSFASGFIFRQGLFLRLYEASLCWFAHHARPLKVMPETTKQGEKLLYGGLPAASFESLIHENKFSDLQATDYGYTWDCAGQSVETLYPQWREEQLAAIAERPGKNAVRRAGTVDGRVLEGIRTFELARATPMKAMLAVAEWQEVLRGPVDRVEKTAHVQLQAPCMAGLSHEFLGFVYGRMGAFALAVGITVVNEQPGERFFRQGHQPGFHHPVGKGGCENLPQFRFLHGKARVLAWPPCRTA